MKKNTIIAIVSLVILVLIGALTVWYVLAHPFPSSSGIKNDPALMQIYNNALAEEKKLAENNSTPLYFLTAGLEWKKLGDATKEDKWYKQSLKTYTNGAVKFEYRNTVLLANAANVAELIGDYETARTDWEKAVEASPGDQSYYVGLIKILRYKLKAPPDEILQVYADGLSRVMNATDLYNNKYYYLKDLKRRDDARQALDDLKERGLITDSAYQSELSDLNALAQK